MKHESVQARFSSVAAMRGNKTAIARPDRSVSYAELSDRSNRLANFLVSAGVAKGTPVAIFAEDSIEVITAIIGILKAGCIFVPLDLKLPANRLTSMLSQVSPEWFLTESKFLTTIAPHTASARGVVCLDSSEDCANVPMNVVRFGSAPNITTRHSRRSLTIRMTPATSISRRVQQGSQRESPDGSRA